MRDYDVVVVGARVAGASTAMLIARAGHRVLLVDRAPAGTDTVSTHAILRTGVLQLSRWGVLDRVIDAGTPPVGAAVLGFGSERTAFDIRREFGVTHLYAPRRHLLDSVLVDAAVAAGVTYAPRTRLRELRRDHTGRVTGVTVATGGATVGITAGMVVGADGVRSSVATLAGAPTVSSHRAMNAVHYAYYDGIETPGFWFQFTPGLNAGLVPTNDGAVLVYTGRRRRSSATTGARDAGFLRLLAGAGADLADRVDGGRRVSRFHGTPGVPGHVRRPHGPGWALVGDAGFTTDPISAHGISAALRDAELCAGAVDRALRRPDLELAAMTGYETRRNATAWPMYREAQALAAYEWTAEEASAHMRRVSQIVRDECASLAPGPRHPGFPSAPPMCEPAPGSGLGLRRRRRSPRRRSGAA